MTALMVKNTTYPIIDNKENPVFLKNKKNIHPLQKKKYAQSLWRKVIRKKRRANFNAYQENKNLFFRPPLSLTELELASELVSFVQLYSEGNKIENLYRKYIQNKDRNEHAYRHFYNNLSAKIQVLQIVSIDQGNHFELASNIATKLLHLLTYSFEAASSLTLTILGAGTRCLTKQVNDVRKINKAKNKLSHCITENNFIKLLSILLTKAHEPDFAHQENIDLFLEKQFAKFWSLFKNQVKKQPNEENLNQFWSICLFRYFQALQCPLLKENFYTYVKETTAVEAIEKNSNAHQNHWQPLVRTLKASHAIQPMQERLATYLLPLFTLQAITTLQICFMLAQYQHYVDAYLIRSAAYPTSLFPRLAAGFWKNADITAIPADTLVNLSTQLAH